MLELLFIISAAVSFITLSNNHLVNVAAARVPTFNSLIDGIQRKKYRESLVIAVIVALILCFSVW